MSDPIVVITDSHGCHIQLIQMFYHLRVGGYLDTHIVIVDGDMIDRGPDSRRCIDTILLFAKMNSWRIRVIGTNHSYTFSRAIVDGDNVELDHRFEWYDCWRKNYENGFLDSYDIDTTLSPLATVNAVLRLMPAEHFELLCSAPWFYEDDDHVYVHAGLHTDRTWEEQRRQLLHYELDDPLGPSQLFSHQLGQAIEHPAEGKMLITGHSVQEARKPFMTQSRLKLNCGVDDGGPLAAYISSEQRCVHVVDGRLVELETISA